MLSLCILSAASLWAAPAEDTFALRATQVHIGDGTVLLDAFVVVEGDKIKSVGQSAPGDVRIVDVDGQIAPGFIALGETTGASGENRESARKSTPLADLSHAFDPHHPGWKPLVAQGVTTVLMTADSSRIAGGLATLVSPARGEVVQRGVALTLGLSSRSLSLTEEPTSYAGLYDHVTSAFEGAADGSPLARARAGELPVMIEALTRMEVLRAAGFAKEMGLSGAIVGAPKADETLDVLRDAGLGVVFEPLRPGGSDDVVDSAMALAEAGVPFAFASDAASAGPAAIRMTLGACTRGGLDAKTALKAVTGSAAEIAGVGDTHGTIAGGKAADLVVWSGDPADLTSRVRAVYAAGELVHEAEERGAGR
ncbi:MAG: amidohydrolase family protein [Planctomycetota bacterium]